MVCGCCRKYIPCEIIGYTHWFMSIRIYYMKDHSISVDQGIYVTSTNSKYLNTVTFRTSTKFYNSTFPSDMIFVKYDASTSDEQIEKLTKDFDIRYRACIG